MEILTTIIAGVIIGGQCAFIMKFSNKNNELKMDNNRLQMSENQFRKEVARLNKVIDNTLSKEYLNTFNACNKITEFPKDMFIIIPKIKKIIDGKLYDTEKCECLGKRIYENFDNVSFLLRASDGQLLETNTHPESSYMLYIPELAVFDLDKLSDFAMTEEQEKRCVELGIIEIIN